MKTLPIHIARKLEQLLLTGTALPASELKHAVIDKMLEDGILSRQLQGKQKAKIRLVNADDLQAYLHNQFGIDHLTEYVLAMQKPMLSRSEAVAVASDSKLGRAGVFKGFLVNVLEPITCSLNGKPFMMQPAPGACSFISDYEHFLPPANATIVGLENAENFSRLPEQSYLFAGMGPLLFVCRYPQNMQLVHWLTTIPNPYLHFGDLDFAGIRIYLTEYKSRLGDRARFFVPVGTEALLQTRGNKDLYTRQYGMHSNTEMLPEIGLQKLANWLHFYKKGLEQEAFISSYLA